MLRVLIFGFLLSCSNPEIEKNVYSHPKYINRVPQHKSIQIVATNNFKGHLTPHFQTLPVEDQSPKEIQVGGTEMTSKYFQAIRTKFKGTSIFFDTGEIFPSNIDRSNQFSILNAYDKLNYDAVVFTDQELIHLGKIEKAYGNHKVPFISSNIVSLKDGKHPLPSYQIVEKDGIKIGVIGISTYRSIQEKYIKRISGVYFEDAVVSIIKKKNALKSKGVNAIILLAHLNTGCHSSNPTKTLNGSQPQFHQLNCPNDDDELVKIVKRLPPNSIDLIIASDKNFANGFIGKIPVLQGPGKGKYLNFAEIFFDKESGKLLTEFTKIYSPTKLCHSFFKQTLDCYYPTQDDDPTPRQELIYRSFFEQTNAEFLDQPISK